MKKQLLTAALCLSILSCGCTDLREIEPTKVEIGNNPSASTTTTTTTPATTSTPTETTVTQQTDPAEESAEPAQLPSTTTTSTSSTTPPDEPEETTEPTEAVDAMCNCYIPYGNHYLDDSKKAFIDDSLFVGDSICSGFEVYGIIDPDKVIATKSVGARNLLDFKHVYKGKEYELSYILKKAKPKYVFFSMGMNDINMTGPETFCDNYSRLIDLALKETDAEIFYCAITPVDSDFTTNERVQLYNNSMYEYIAENYPERVHTVDFGKLLVCDDGVRLCDQIAGGDGIHLAPYAYHIALWEIRNVLDDIASKSQQTAESDEAITSEAN